MSRLQSPLDKK
jgi:hypothetical protein